jgi:hypothetical protein
MFSDYIGDRPSITPKASCSTLALKTRSETHSTRSANNSDDDEKKKSPPQKKRKVSNHPRGTMLNWLKQNSLKIQRNKKNRKSLWLNDIIQKICL